MTKKLLALRLRRRAIAAAQVVDESLTLSLGQHLTSNGDRAVAGVTRFLTKIVDAANPVIVVLDCSRRRPGTVIDDIALAIEAFLKNRGLPFLYITTPELLSAYGVPSLRNRRELRELAFGFWPELGQIIGRVQPYIADAAVAALYADTRFALERVVG
jgi:hypothetical protein